jgi:hypothetical protein
LPDKVQFEAVPGKGSAYTALRGIDDLLARDVLRRLGAGGRG